MHHPVHGEIVAELSRAQIITLLNTGANLAGLDLRDADLRGLNLSQTDFTGTDMRGADLRGCVLFSSKVPLESDPTPPRSAQLRGARLEGADLRDVRTTDGKPDDRIRSQLTIAGASVDGAIANDDQAKKEQEVREVAEFRAKANPTLFTTEFRAELDQMRAAGEPQEAIDRRIRERRQELKKQADEFHAQRRTEMEEAAKARAAASGTQPPASSGSDADEPGIGFPMERGF